MELSVEACISDSRVAFMQGKFDEALRLAKHALSEDANNPDAHQCAANAYMSKADYETAIKHYAKAAENDPDNGDRYFNLGYGYASNNEQVKALESFAKADEAGCSPNVAGQLYKIMAMVCFELQRYDDAILNFIKAEKIIGVDMDILQRKALSYTMSGDTIAGIEVANQMKLLAPTDYLGYRIAFNILLQEDRLEEAEKELDRAERFAKPTKELFFDWVAYLMARYHLEHDTKYLKEAIDQLFKGSCVIKPKVSDIIDFYVEAADVYVQLEDADMALNCLRAAENPVQSYNYGFTIKKFVEYELKSEGRPSSQEVDRVVAEIRRKYGDRRLEAMGRQQTARARAAVSDADKYVTPVAEKPAEEEIPKIDSDDKAQYSFEMLDRIYRLYVSAYTIKNDTANIKAYAAKLANSSNPQSKYIGKYSLVKALKQEGYEKAEEEYRDLLKMLRNAMIKDPTDLTALSLRAQCHVDLGEFDEAENLCNMLSDDLAASLREQIEAARSGGDS